MQILSSENDLTWLGPIPPDIERLWAVFTMVDLAASSASTSPFIIITAAAHAANVTVASLVFPKDLFGHARSTGGTTQSACETCMLRPWQVWRLFPLLVCFDISENLYPSIICIGNIDEVVLIDKYSGRHPELSGISSVLAEVKQNVARRIKDLDGIK